MHIQEILLRYDGSKLHKLMQQATYQWMLLASKNQIRS